MDTNRRAFVLFIKNEQLLLLRDAQRQERLKLPGGKVEFGESFLQAAIREVTEEVGVILTPKTIQAIHLSDVFWEGEHFINAIFVAESWLQEPTLCEPTEHAELMWAPIASIPNGVFPPLLNGIKLALAGNFYSEWQ
jgi:8-oxo-dGTP pyrophosphatase MutT (NUDIX family)